MDPFDEIRTIPLPPHEETLYYYRKPGSQKGDPCFILSSKNVHLIGGEIFIGKEMDHPVVEDVVKFFTIFLSGRMKEVFKIQLEYFGEDIFSHIREESIKLLKRWHSILIDNNIELPENIEMILKNELWPF